MKIEIYDSRLSDIKDLAETVREKDNEEAKKLGLSFQKALEYTYKSAIYRKTVLINSKIAAMFGVTGSIFEQINGVYFLTGQNSLQLSYIRFVRLYLEELEKLSWMFPHLICLIDSEYHEASRLAEIAGFKKESERMLNGNMFHVYELKV